VILFLLAPLLHGAPARKSPSATAPPAIHVTRPLPELLQTATAAFAAGDYATAAELFTQVERDYGAEEQWASGPLPQKLLPLKGFAELQSGAPADAAGSLGAFLERFPDDAGQRSFVLYALALALRQSGRLEAALDRFATYEKENASSAQAALAAFQRAEILFELQRADEAFATLDTIAAGASSESLRYQARLRALQKATDLHRDDMAAKVLFEHEWFIESMPEIAVLAFSAMEIGDRLLANNRPADALRAYRLVLPKKTLVVAQRQRLEALRGRFDERAAAVAAGNGAFWVEFYRTRIARIDAELRGLEASEDYTAPLRLRTGQAYLLALRPREAWLVFEAIATDPKVSGELRREAHYRWILCAAERESWSEALIIAREFNQRFGNATEAPEVFHLIARAHLEERRFPEAAEVLGDLIERFPEAPAAERARFTRGWIRTMQEEFTAAREDFDRYAADHPNGALKVSAGLWRALSFFFERRYPDALEAFDALAAENEKHLLFAEILYRRGTTLYAMREHTRARAEMEAFLTRFPEHPRQPEALVLLGDILMGAGQLTEARRRFAEIPAHAINSYIYGVFQTGKILRAQEDFAAMAGHFRAYAGREDLAAQPRISEALYWIGWAEEQRGHPEVALPVYLDVLERFGNDPAAGEVASTLEALRKLVLRLHGRREGVAGETVGGFDPRAAPLLGAGFDAWLSGERERSRLDGELTRFARLALFAADRHLARKESAQAEVLILAVASDVPVEALDAAALARVGLTLQEVGSPDCSRYFERLLEKHPASFERGAAFFGLAAEAAKERRKNEALRWIDRFENETPTHPLAPRAALLAALTLEQAGEFASASESFENILRLKSARGRTHAEALMGLARCAAATNDARRAVAYCQRVYNLHRAQKDLAADAYLRSGDLFSSLGDAPSAAATYREMLSLPDVGSTDQREQARKSLQAVERLIVPRPEPQIAPSPQATTSAT